MSPDFYRLLETRRRRALRRSLGHMVPALLLILGFVWFFWPSPLILWILAGGAAVVTWVYLDRVPGLGGRALSPWEAPDLVSAVTVLSRRAGLQQIPRLVWIPSSAVNAAASTAGGGTIYITDGLLSHLGSRELAGVLAHEISHLRHGDLFFGRGAESLRMGFQTFFIASLWFLDWTVAGLYLLMVLSLVIPLVLQRLLMRFMRSREFAADAGAAALTGDPEALASALARIDYRRGLPWWLPVPESRMDATHPPTQERVRRLLERPRALPVVLY